MRLKHFLIAITFSLLLAPCVLLAQPKPAKHEFAQEIQRNFREWDRNGDSRLSEDEIDRVVTDPKVKGRAAAAAAALELTLRNKKFNLPPLTRDYLVSAPSGIPDTPDYERSFQSALTKINKTPRNLFSNGKPHREMLHQGRMGDCFFLAPFGALLHRDANVVKEMIQQKEDGNFQVKFKGAKPITVTPLTDAELALSASNEGDGLWVSLFEKAYAELRNEQLPSDKQKVLATDLIAAGGNSGRVIEILTDHETKSIGFRTREAKDQPLTGDALLKKLDQLRPVLMAACTNHHLITAGTPETVTTPGVKPKHAYAVLGFDAKKDEIILWNPHGNSFKPKGSPGVANGYVTTKGDFVMPLREFVQVFRSVTFETGKTQMKKSK